MMHLLLNWRCSCLIGPEACPQKGAACAKGHHDIRMEPVPWLANDSLAELRERLLLADVIGKLCRAETGAVAASGSELVMSQKHIFFKDVLEVGSSSIGR